MFQIEFFFQIETFFWNEDFSKLLGFGDSKCSKSAVSKTASSFAFDADNKIPTKTLG